MGYNYKTEPFKHQRKIFDETWLEKHHGLLLEQGLGKSKILIDTAARLRQRGKIDAMFVIAPNGVHTNWLTDEIPDHMPDKILDNAIIHCHTTSGAKTQRGKRHATECLKAKGFAILLMSYSSMMTENGRALAKSFLQRRECLYALDESHFIKTPGAKRTKRIVSSGTYAKYKRILTGTPVAQGPFDVYTQIKFLSPEFWKERGFGTFASFKSHFGIFQATPFCPNGMLVDYKNIPELQGYVSEICTRLTKDDSGLELPEKLYSKRYFNMTPVQRRMYSEINDDLTTILSPGEVVEVDNPLVKMLRLQQITCNYIPIPREAEYITDKQFDLKPIGPTNPRLNALQEICESLAHPALIWARFTEDIDQIMSLLGKEAVRYDGAVDVYARQMSKEKFKQGRAKFMVLNPAAGATGLTLNNARTSIYYSSSYKLVDRLQSEDRNHRIGQKYPVEYIDIVCKDTIDDRIADALRDKRDLSNQVTGDQSKSWI